MIAIWGAICETKAGCRHFRIAIVPIRIAGADNVTN
jgi:hypothetical protein